MLKWITIFTLVFSTSYSNAWAETLPMPGRFHLDADPKRVLSEYPLGMLDKQATLIHQGPADRALTLPNGKEAWLYDAGGKDLHRTYTVVFDNQGTVTDVLFYDHGRHYKFGLSALLLQSEAIRTKEPALGSGPDGSAPQNIPQTQP